MQVAPAAPGIAVSMGFALVTKLHIVIGELAPEGLAIQRPEAPTLAGGQHDLAGAPPSQRRQ